jgi:acyl-CoA synthetase (AMP-forming)/AMP-acid ligase II
MAQGPDDVVCCPPPLFHCFGLVIGFLASFCCGNAIVFPSDYFDARRCVDAIMRERATILLGVPTMYLSIMEVMAQSGHRPRRLGKAIAAGTSVPQVLRTQLRQQMGVRQTIICYGMTETSPVTIMTSVDDPEDKQTVTVGRELPHTAAKVIDVQGNILPRGERGELCTSGFALQKGYWKNEKKTREVMKMDEDGVRWMHTGDEGIIDNEGYTQITGRIKDVIIRGMGTVFACNTIPTDMYRW